MLDFVFEPAFWASIILLIGMEIALGADNAIFISSNASRLPEGHRQRFIRLGVLAAALFRLILLACIIWLLGLENRAFTIGEWSPSWRDVVLLAGGTFLAYKAVSELDLLADHGERQAERPALTISANPTLALFQIILLNAVFSVDSVITAVGLTTYVPAMAIAVVASVFILYFAAGKVALAIERHPSIKAVALAFLFVVGAVLVTEGLGGTVVRMHLYLALGIGFLVVIMARLWRGGREDVGILPSATTTATPDERSEPTLEPAKEGDEAYDMRDIEPEIPLESTETPDVGDQEATDDIPEALPDEEAEKERAPQSDEVVEQEVVTEDEPALGESGRAVQKSRRKRSVFRRRPERLRTARRRE